MSYAPPCDLCGHDLNSDFECETCMERGELTREQHLILNAQEDEDCRRAQEDLEVERLRGIRTLPADTAKLWYCRTCLSNNRHTRDTCEWCKSPKGLRQLEAV